MGMVPQAVLKGRPAKPQRVKVRGVPSGYVEGLNDARTPLADFFGSLLVLVSIGEGSTVVDLEHSMQARYTFSMWNSATPFLSQDSTCCP